jgi:hypothetical protein
MVTSQKIAEYYERYRTIDVTFTKEVIRVTGIITKQVYLKCGGDFWPCVIFSTSFQGAKVVVNANAGVSGTLQKANNIASLRMAFKTPDSDAPVAFFVNVKVIGNSSYGSSGEMELFSLQYSQRPPDDLIGIVGRVLEANINSHQRKEERVSMTPEAIRKLNLVSKETAVFIQKVPRRCILRDLSFSGAKIIMVGVAKFLEGKEADLRVDFQEPRESFLLPGVFIRSENVEGRHDLIALGVKFTEGQIPMGYKMRINDYLGSQHFSLAAKAQIKASNPPAAAPAPATDAKTDKAPAPAKALAPSLTDEVDEPPPPPMPGKDEIPDLSITGNA